VLLAAAALGLVACAQLPVDEPAAAHAWTQAADIDGTWLVRAVTRGAACPTLRWRSAGADVWNELPMTLRAPPGVVAARGPAAESPTGPSRFDLRSCEAPWPAAAVSAQVGGVALPAPHRVVDRIVLLGDSGCRMKLADAAFQDCADPVAWPLASVARSAAAKHPDLVVHVGDYHYRESPCPAGMAGCAGSPWGYGDDVWEADLLVPAAPLLTAAPWVFVRGNHESCNRAGVGWARWLDPRPWTAATACEDPARDAEGDHDAPYAVPLSADTQLIVFDSSAVKTRGYRSDDPALARLTNDVRRMGVLAAARPHNLVAHHHPALAFAGDEHGAAKPGVAGLQQAMAAVDPTRLYPPGVDLVLNGHFHLFEALGFSSGQPATLVVGNGGSQMEGHVGAEAARASRPAPGAVVDTFVTQPGFGFATLDRTARGWHLTEWGVGGEVIVECELDGAALSCGPAAR